MSVQDKFEAALILKSKFEAIQQTMTDLKSDLDWMDIDTEDIEAQLEQFINECGMFINNVDVEDVLKEEYAEHLVNEMRGK